ncbi:retrovirus-related pol polyprotein from transposon TNT 1-94 [Tanacetum coccineum]
MENLDSENVSLEFQVQSLIKERDNVKTEYQKLFNSIKKTRAQTQGEINELNENFKQKTYAYADVHAQNRDLLLTISELKAKLKTVEYDKSVNTKFDKVNVSKKLLCVTPSNKQVFQKKTVVPNTEEKHVLSKIVVQIILWIVDSGCSKHMTEGDDLLTGDRESNLYTISIPAMTVLSHLNFGNINDLTKHDLVDGLLKFKYGKDHLCSACERGKSKKSSHPPKLVPRTHSMLEFLHMDLCGPMRVASINGKKYILVIVDDYSRFTWVYFLHTKDETTEIIKNFIARVQLNFNAKVCKIRTDNGTEFKNATLKAHYNKLGIMQ